MEWSNQLIGIIKKREKTAELIFRKTALDVATSIIMKTPVDTGRARGNWNSAIGRVDMSTSETASEGYAVSNAGNVSMSLSLSDTYTIANGLPYIRRLEYGWSRQAPSGMVRITQQEFRQILRKIGATNK